MTRLGGQLSDRIPTVPFKALPNARISVARWPKLANSRHPGLDPGTRLSLPVGDGWAGDEAASLADQGYFIWIRVVMPVRGTARRTERNEGSPTSVAGLLLKP